MVGSRDVVHCIGGNPHEIDQGGDGVETAAAARRSAVGIVGVAAGIGVADCVATGTTTVRCSSSVGTDRRSGDGGDSYRIGADGVGQGCNRLLSLDLPITSIHWDGSLRHSRISITRRCRRFIIIARLLVVVSWLLLLRMLLIL